MRLHLLPLALSLFAIPCASRSPIYSISLLPKRAAPQPLPGVGASARTREGKALPHFKQPASLAPQRYSLPPEKRAKAIAYSRIRYTLYFVGAAFSLGIYFFIWRARIAALFQSWARRISRRFGGLRE